MSTVLLRRATPPPLAGEPAPRLKILHAITDLDVGGAETMLCRLLGAHGGCSPPP